jgi:hypothetical protein
MGLPQLHLPHNQSPEKTGMAGGHNASQSPSQLQLLSRTDHYPCRGCEILVDLSFSMQHPSVFIPSLLSEKWVSSQGTVTALLTLQHLPHS